MFTEAQPVMMARSASAAVVLISFISVPFLLFYGSPRLPSLTAAILATAFGVMPNSLAPQRLPTMASLWPRDNEDTGGDKWQRMTGRLYKLWHQAPDLCKKGHPKSICCHRQSPNRLRVSPA